jgi:hypothetical protein
MELTLSAGNSLDEQSGLSINEYCHNYLSFFPDDAHSLSDDLSNLSGCIAEISCSDKIQT